MPLRNLTILLVTAFFSLACYSQANRNRYASILSDAIEKVSDYYVEPVDRRTLFEGGLRGMLSELDPYSGYIPPKEWSDFQAEIEQHFGGIGVEVGVENEELTVLNPIPGSPAYEAGIMAGDVIVAIDNEDVRGASLDEAVTRMRGPEGEPVNVRIRRKGEAEEREFRIVRQQIRVESVRGDWRNLRGQWQFQWAQDERIGYIRLASFGDRTAEDLQASLKQIEGKVDGILLDLRGNAGGLLGAAIQVCDMFLPEGRVIVTTRGRDGVTTEIYQSSTPPLVSPDIPLVILVDHFSASASEIVAACLQDYGRATIVGERTWGKGTVQQVISIERGRSAIKLTTQTYWRPSGVNIHRLSDDTDDDPWGVQPVLENRVEFTVEEYQRVYEARRLRDLPRAEAPPAMLLASQDAPASSSGEAITATETKAETEAPEQTNESPADSLSSGERSESTAAPSNEATTEKNSEPSLDTQKASSANLAVDRQLQRAVEVLRARIQSADSTR